MIWLEYLAYFMGGGLLANSMPHYVSGVCGRAFQSPFASPPGRGFSSATVNVLWGFANMVGAYFLFLKIGAFDWREGAHALAVGLGVLTAGLILARHLGQIHGGNLPPKT